MIQVLIVFCACLCFGILFNLNREHLFFAALGGAFGYAVYMIALHYELPYNIALFLATIAFSTYSEIIARLRKTTVATCLIISLIPFVPGKGMYLTMLAIVNNQLEEALEVGLQTITDASILALSIIVVSTVFKVIKSFTRKLA